MRTASARPVVCAAIENNPDNVEYGSYARSRYPDRFHVIADLDCTWHETYHRAGSADRMRALSDRYQIAGFTHYLGRDNDGWLASDEAEALLTAAEERGLLVSLAATPVWQADLRVLARRHPGVPILCHHLGGVSAEASADPTGLQALIESVSCPNIYIKASGFHYVSPRGWDYPWPDAIQLFRQIFEAFGPDRLCWASDFPASTRHCTYRQSLEVVRTHCSFLGPDVSQPDPRRHAVAHPGSLTGRFDAGTGQTPHEGRCATRKAMTIGRVVITVAAKPTFSGVAP